MRVITEKELKDIIQEQGLGAYQTTGPFQKDIFLIMRKFASRLFDLGHQEEVVDDIPESLRGIFFPE